jgi:hypothetical protein
MIRTFGKTCGDGWSFPAVALSSATFPEARKEFQRGPAFLSFDLSFSPQS